MIRLCWLSHHLHQRRLLVQLPHQHRLHHHHHQRRLAHAFSQTSCMIPTKMVTTCLTASLAWWLIRPLVRSCAMRQMAVSASATERV